MARCICGWQADSFTEHLDTADPEVDHAVVPEEEAEPKAQGKQEDS